VTVDVSAVVLDVGNPLPSLTSILQSRAESRSLPLPPP
jgi:hypothetical protein